MPIRTAGQLTQRVTLQQRVTTTNAIGETVSTWADVATVWAGAEPLRGRELFAASQAQSSVSVRLTIRWRAGVDAGMRVVWRGEPYAIEGEPIDVDGRREWLELMCSKGGTADAR